MTPTLTHNTSHVANGLGNLILQFKEKPRFAVVMVALLLEVQAVEDAFWQLLTQRLTNQSPVGAQLDVLGRIVNQPREGLGDADYLVRINARILANRSDSTVNALITILQTIIGTSPALAVRESYKAIEFEADGLGAFNAYQIWREFLVTAKEAGTAIRFTYGTAASANMLKLGDASPAATFTTTTAQRIDDSNVPGGGGLLAGVAG